MRRSLTQIFQPPRGMPASRRRCERASCSRIARFERRSGSRECIPRPQHREQIGHAGIAAELRQQRRHLPAMVGLVVEQVRERPPQRMAELGTL